MRENRPQSGLSITPEALQNYERLKTQEDANAVIRARLADARKTQKKEQKFQAEIAKPLESEVEHGLDFDYLRVEPGESSIWSAPIVIALPTLLCLRCSTPVYFYECQDPPTCLDCEFPEEKGII